MIFFRAQRWARVGIFVWAFVGMRAATADVLFDYTSDSSGYWYEGANWSQGFAPNGALDVVTIDRPAADPTVTYNGTTGTSQIKSLTSSESIVLSGGTLEILDFANLSGSFSITGGTLQGGVITTTEGLEVNYASGNTIDSLTLEGDLKLESNQDRITITGGLLLDGTIDVTGKDAYVYFNGTQTLSELGGGTATLSMGGSNSPPDYARVYVTGGGVLTIGADVTVEGKGYLMSSGGSAIHNEGTIHANQSGTLYITSETFVNEAGGTLQVSGGSSLSLAATAFENHGAIGLTDGGLLYTSGLGAAGLELTLGISLLGDGTVSGNVTNTAGSLSPEAITLNGDYVQAAAGELFIGIGGLVQGVEYDFLDVSGVATLGGSLRLELEDGFVPSLADTFVILEAAGGLSGTFDSVVSTDGSVWSLDYQPTQVILSFEQLVVPEPATLLTLLLGSLMLLLARRR